jgi:adenosylmethionine-8-amino-7-oxononanoate aminotransferase
VVIMPPLTTTESEIDRIVDALEAAVRDVTGP